MLTPEEQERSADIQRRADEQAERRYLLDVAQYELMKKMAEAQGINVSSLNRNKSAYDGLYGATNKQTAIAQANAFGLEANNKATDNNTDAKVKGTASTVAFTKALLSGEEGFAKYNQSLSAAGDAVFALSKNFGLLGMAVGALFKGSTKLIELSATQADNSLKATDQLSKMGAMNSFTADEVRKMGARMGLASDQLDKMVKPMASLSGGLTRLGATSADGVDAFVKLTTVTKETRNEFLRMGLNDQERIQAQADYIVMMERTGSVLSGQLKTSQGQQKASLEYTRNLYELSSITGKNIEDSKKDMEIARASYEWKLQENKWARELAAATERKDQAEIDRIEAEKEGANRLLNDITKLGDQTKVAGFQLQYLTGAITPANSQFAVLGIDLEKQIKAAKENTYVSGEFNNVYKKAANDMLASGTASLALSDDFKKATGLEEKALDYVNKRYNVANEVVAAAESKAKLKANEEGKGKAAEDPAQIMREARVEAERTAKLFADKLVADFNPLLKGFDSATMAATALAGAAMLAAIALTAMAGLDALKGLKGLAGKGGTPGGRMPGGAPPTAPAPASPTKPSGMSVDEKAKYDKLRSEGMSASEAKRQAGGFNSLVSAENKITPPKPVTPTIPVGAATETLAKEAGALSKMGGALSTASKFAGPAAGAVSVLSGGYTALQGSKAVDEKVKSGEITKDEGTVQKSEAVGKGTGGAVVGLGGAALGAAIGTMIFPVVGTAIGAAFGGWLGSKGGEMVGENVGTIVGKSIIEKPKVDTSGRATATTDPRVVGTQQNPANVKATEPTSTKPTTATTDASGRATASTDPRLKNAGAESPENVAKGIADMAKENATRASVSNAEPLKSNKEFVSLEINITALNKTLMSTNTALTNLTATISTNKPTTFKTSETKPVTETKPVQVKLTTDTKPVDTTPKSVQAKPVDTIPKPTDNTIKLAQVKPIIDTKPVDTIPKLVDTTPKPIDNTIKSASVKPMTDVNDMGAAAIYSKLVGSIQLATAKPTNTTPSVSIADIQANMTKGMNQPEAQKAAEAKAEREAKAKFDTSTRATSATDSKLVGVSTNLDMENPVVIARQMKEDAQKTIEQRIIDTQKITKASDSQEVSMTTLNRTLLSTNTALKDLTGSITNITNPTTSDSSTNKPVTGGGISIPAGILASFKSALGGSSGGASGGASGTSTVKSTGAPTSEPTASTMAMTSEGKKPTKPAPQPAEGSENNTESAKQPVDLAKIMKFGTGSGTQQNFEELNDTFQNAVTAAATEYNSVTGNKLTINSAKRDPQDQQRLWDESVAAGRPGKGPTGMAIGKPGRSLHEKGEAVDIQNYKDPDAIAAMNKQGLTQKVPGDPVHFQAELGGILNGPKSGYPVEGTMHGREAIIPLNPDSIITKLLTTSEAQVKQEMNNTVTTNTSSSDNTSQIMADLYSMMEEKFDAMIDALEDGNDHTEKLVRFSAV